MNVYLPQPYLVESKTQENAYTVTFRLSPKNESLVEARPGQFSMLYLYGVGEVPISFSRLEPLEHTVAAVGSVTNPLCQVEPGTVLGLRGPYGNPWPVDQARGKDLVLMAGGLGLAPLRPVIDQVLSRREDFGRVWVLYGARSPSEQLYKEEVAAWLARTDFEFLVTVDRSEPGWRLNVGLVTNLLSRVDRRLKPERAMAFVCGPEIMMRVSVRELAGRGIPKDHIFLSHERNMKCGHGLCGHCQFGPLFLCRDGPVVRLDQVADFLSVKEL